MIYAKKGRIGTQEKTETLTHLITECECINKKGKSWKEQHQIE